MKAIGGITITGCVLMVAVCVSRAGNGNDVPSPAQRATAATQPQKLTLEKVFAEVNATDEQKARVRELIKHTGERWCDWVRRHHDDLARTREAYHAAAIRGDAEQADQLKKEYIALVNTLPKSNETWEKAALIFSFDQQAQLNGLKPKSVSNLGTQLLSHPLHDAVRDESIRSALNVGSACIICHLPIEKVAAK